MNLQSSIRTCRLAAALIISSLAFGPAAAAVDSPSYIPFQGQVTNQSGIIVADGQYSVIFNLYDQAVGGQPVWSERHVKIGVTRGMINVFLGSISPLTSVDFSQTKYLGITVDTDNLATTADPEMVPRSLILPAFYAKNAAKLAGYNWSAILAGGSNDPTVGFINGARLAASSVTNEKVAAGAITSESIAAGAVTQEDIALQSVSFDKLAPRNLTAGVIAPAGGVALSPPLSGSLQATSFNQSPSMDVAGSVITITTTGRPLMVSLVSKGPPGGGAPESEEPLIAVGGSSWYFSRLKLYRRQISPVAGPLTEVSRFSLFANNAQTAQYVTPTIVHTDLLSPGTYEYSLKFSLELQVGNTFILSPYGWFNGVKLMALEL